MRSAWTAFVDGAIVVALSLACAAAFLLMVAATLAPWIVIGLGLYWAFK